MSSTQHFEQQDSNGWCPSFYYAESIVTCPLENAWRSMLDYSTWNPGFVGATTIRVCGEPDREGEVVLINAVEPDGVSLPPFYARTIKVEPLCRIAWYCYPEDDAYRIFVEFGLAEILPGIRFTIRWYALDKLPIEALEDHRKTTDETVQTLARAFKAYCEARSVE